MEFRKHYLKIPGFRILFTLGGEMVQWARHWLLLQGTQVFWFQALTDRVAYNHSILQFQGI